jgi:hypothetical protein
MTGGAIAATRLSRPFIVPEPLGGWYVILPNGHGWLHGDREDALSEFAELQRIERQGSA